MSERTRKELGSWLTWVYSQFTQQSLLKNIGENVWPCLGLSLLPMASFTRGSGRFFHAFCMCMCSVAQLSFQPYRLVHQAPLPLGFPRQEYWSRLPFPSLGDLLDPRIEPATPSLAGGFFTTKPSGKPSMHLKPG